MAEPEVLSVQGESPVTAADPTAAVAGSSAASQRWPQLIPIAQLVAVVLGVFAIIWNQQQSIDNLRDELRAEITRLETSLRNEINGVDASLRNEINGVDASLRDEIAGLRSEVRSNGERLARIEGHLGIGIPETATPP